MPDLSFGIYDGLDAYDLSPYLSEQLLILEHLASDSFDVAHEAGGRYPVPRLLSASNYTSITSNQRGTIDGESTDPDSIYGASGGKLPDNLAFSIYLGQVRTRSATTTKSSHGMLLAIR